jgi:hypothetical protein
VTRQYVADPALSASPFHRPGWTYGKVRTAGGSGSGRTPYASLTDDDLGRDLAAFLDEHRALRHAEHRLYGRTGARLDVLLVWRAD